MDNQELDPNVLAHIGSLNEHYGHYERFFDGMLIKRVRHEAFMRDLKEFRQQTSIILLLQQGSREAYRDCTRQFISSRFAHPWVRISPLKRGWFMAEWGATRRLPKDYKKDVENLHASLLPIWCRMRLWMFTFPEGELTGLQPELPPKNWTPVYLPVYEASSSESRGGNEDGLEANNKSAGPLKSPPNASSGQADASAAANLFIGIAAGTMMLKNSRRMKLLALLPGKADVPRR